MSQTPHKCESLCRITVEPSHNGDLGTLKVFLLYQVSCFTRVKKQENVEVCYYRVCCIRSLYNEAPLYIVTLRISNVLCVSSEKWVSASLGSGRFLVIGQKS